MKILRKKFGPEDIKLNFSKNVFFRYKSMYLKSSFQNKIIKNPISKATKFHMSEAATNCDFANCLFIL